MKKYFICQSISTILILVILITGCGQGGGGESVNSDIPKPATNYTFINKWGSGEALYGNCALALILPETSMWLILITTASRNLIRTVFCRIPWELVALMMDNLKVHPE
jgi:hypothetical protein